MCQKQPSELDVYVLDLSQVFMREKETLWQWIGMLVWLYWNPHILYRDSLLFRCLCVASCSDMMEADCHFGRKTLGWCYIQNNYLLKFIGEFQHFPEQKLYACFEIYNEVRGWFIDICLINVSEIRSSVHLSVHSNGKKQAQMSDRIPCAYIYTRDWSRKGWVGGR